ncbi:hypothetical protein [Nocardia sp. NPDC059154]|uniref:MmyB family transcriptional regulator n=2 Tax=unclassified Nocardia TaxID=2637762 RepID=UPI0036CD0090
MSQPLRFGRGGWTSRSGPPPRRRMPRGTGAIHRRQRCGPRSCRVIDDWEHEAHFMVYGFRYTASATHAPERLAAIVDRFSAAPEWDRFWSTEVPPEKVARRPVRVRSPETGEWVSYRMQIFKFELPQRPWWIYSLVPAN